MKLCPISNALLFVFFLLTFRTGSTTPTHFTGAVSINCGSNAASAARNGHQWLGDMQPKLSSLLHINGKSTTSTVTAKLALDDPLHHKTARISRSQFSYTFQVEPGQKIIRLHFNPSPYKGFREFNDLFTVQSGRFTLLRNFSASLNADALAVNTFAKEFCLNIQQNQQLTITFSPETSQSLDAYAFVNGIEILAVPAALSYFGVGDIGLHVVGEKSMVYVDNNTALEIIQRQNLKQDPVSSVKVGFRYLIRLHFSEVGLKIAGTGELRFKVLINEMIAQTNSDILRARDGSFLLYRDYIVMMPGLKTEDKRDILISILSYDELRDGHGVLAGFEIVKLSNHDNSLASPNPLPRPQDSPPTSTRYLYSILGHINTTSTLAITIISLINVISYKLRNILEASSNKEENRPSDRAERLFHHFSLREIQLATEYFHEGHVIGKGGFGKVYKGIVRGSVVAIKRLKSDSKQGEREFLTEIETLSELRHINLVSLIGYSLTWKQRLNICIEAGRGLDYLHTGHRIIHRDVKASNILLDEKFVAKVSDFGLAKADSLKLFVEVAEKCLHDEPKNRPTMSQVVLQLESALEKQANRILALPNHIASVAIDDSPPNEDIITLSESAEQSRREASTDTQSVISSPTVQTTLNSSAVSKESRPSKCNPLRFLVCCACWRRAKLRKEQASAPAWRWTKFREEHALALASAPETCEADTNLLKLVADAANQSSDMCRYFTLREIRKATDGFNENYVISKGRFANLYTGLINSGATMVAIKRLDPSSNQGANEFLTEIQTLSKLRHHNLVSLLGYCNEKGEMILVYENMAHGNLRDHLHNPDNPPLTWKQRLQICLGAAKGLNYLHTGAEHVIIHRDVSTANILLDEKWVAKVYDFGLSELLPSDRDQTHVSTIVKGTFGYLDPEYYMSMRLTVKSDVYSFGVLLLEVLSARKPIIPSLSIKQVNLIEWGISCFRKGKVDKIIDPNIKGQIAPKCLNKFVETAVACLSNRGIDRPAMRDVVGSLELAMQLQESLAIDEAPLEQWMTTTTSQVNLKESKYEHGLKSRWTQKDKLLSLSSAEQSDDSYS